VFTILVIVNFVFLTKGSVRIAKWPARFHLDACRAIRWQSMPPFPPASSMENEADDDGRRSKTSRGFFGPWTRPRNSWRGDAVAGLLVVVHQHHRGMVFGIAQQGLSFARPRAPTRCSRSATPGPLKSPR